MGRVSQFGSSNGIERSSNHTVSKKGDCNISLLNIRLMVLLPTRSGVLSVFSCKEQLIGK